LILTFIALAEQAEGQAHDYNNYSSQLMKQMGTASGMGEDYDINPATGAPPQSNTFNLQRNPPANATPEGTLGTQ
jgi:hypothetical protein